MRVLSFSSCFPSGQDPITGVFVLRRLRALANLVPLEVAHPVPWFPAYRLRRPAPPCEEQIEGLTVYHPRFFYLPGVLKRFDGRFYAAGLGRWLQAYCAGKRPDLFDAHWSWPDGVGVSYLARRLGVPYTITLRGVIMPRYKIPRFRWRLADALEHAAAVISLNRVMADIAVELGARHDRTYVIPNGVQADRFDVVPQDQARQRLGLPKGIPLIVSVASLIPQKGHAELIEALKALPLEVRLVIVGGEVGNGSYRYVLESLAARHGIGSRVTFAGRQPQDAVATYLSAADLSVLASHSEGCPNVVIESLACGTPVVATAVGGIPEIIRLGENGEIVPPRNPKALGAALKAGLARSWSRQAVRQSIASRSWDKVAQEVVEVFRTVLADRR